MLNLNFKNWFEDLAKKPLDPEVEVVSRQAKMAATDAIKRKQNPLKAMQKTVLSSNLPSNKIGKVLPKDEDDSDMS